MTTVLDWACPGNLKVLGTLDVVGGFSGAVSTTRIIATNVTNQIELGTGNTTIINSLAPAADRTYTLLDAGVNANFVLTEGTYTINSTLTFVNTINTGSTNVRIGDLAGGSGGIRNVAIGSEALLSNFNNDNTAIGYRALRNVIFGGANTAIGASAGSVLNSGSLNVLIGSSAAPSLLNGNTNVLIGPNAGNGLIIGNNNIFIGDGNAFAIGNYTNSISIGGPALGSNWIRMGNAAITNAFIQVAWFVTSDKNKKKQIEPANLGLEFIKKLRPRKYLLKTEADETPKKRYGLIAQEVEEVLNSLGITDFSAVRNTNDVYSLRYHDLFPCLIKALQELRSIYIKK